jgi:predicted PurR-regulated permease PerM
VADKKVNHLAKNLFMAEKNPSQNIFPSLVKLISLVAAYIVMLWFFYEIAGVLLLILLSIILAIIVNAPVVWLEKRRIKRFWACMIVFATIIVIAGLLGWLIVPKISAQVTVLVNNIPEYINTLSIKLKEWFGDYPGINDALKGKGNTLTPILPSFGDALTRISNYSLSLIGYILVFIVFISMVAYIVLNPAPLVETYLNLFPLRNRDKAANALTNASTMLVGWMRANLIGGTIEAVSVIVFLNFMNVQGAWVWGALAFFAELIPRIGFYIMAIPPILVALASDPVTAIWVTAFYLIMDEILGDFVMPKLRSNTMKIHAVSSLFLMLAMGSAFGLKGVLIATPMAAIIKAYYEEFYLSRIKNDGKNESRIHKILYNTTPKIDIEATAKDTKSSAE